MTITSTSRIRPSHLRLQGLLHLQLLLFPHKHSMACPSYLHNPQCTPQSQAAPPASLRLVWPCLRSPASRTPAHLTVRLRFHSLHRYRRRIHLRLCIHVHLRRMVVRRLPLRRVTPSPTPRVMRWDLEWLGARHQHQHRLFSPRILRSHLRHSKENISYLHQHRLNPIRRSRIRQRLSVPSHQSRPWQAARLEIPLGAHQCPTQR
jgi:hypothetical protein